jgi:hypothetical protein
MDRSRAFTDAVTRKVELDFAGWRVWRSRDRDGQPAGWWASRRHGAVWVEPQTVAGDTEAKLRAELAAAPACADSPVL